MPVSSPWAPAAGWSVTARIPQISARAPLELPQQLERALGDLVGRHRVEVGEAGQAGRPLVELRVELHRARAERVEPGVDRVVELRQVDVVADDLGLVQLGQGRRRRPPGARPGSGRARPWAGAGSCRRRGPAGRARRGSAGALAGDAHRAAPTDGRRPIGAAGSTPTAAGRQDRLRARPRTGRSRSVVVTSVAQTSSASARVGSSGSASARARPARTPAVEQPAMDRPRVRDADGELVEVRARDGAAARRPRRAPPRARPPGPRRSAATSRSPCGPIVAR